jgi:hypothetical protein
MASNYVDFSFIPLFTDFKNKTIGSAVTNDAQSGGLEGVLKGLNSLRS